MREGGWGAVRVGRRSAWFGDWMGEADWADGLCWGVGGCRCRCRCRCHRRCVYRLRTVENELDGCGMAEVAAEGMMGGVSGSERPRSETMPWIECWRIESLTSERLMIGSWNSGRGRAWSWLGTCQGGKGRWWVWKGSGGGRWRLRGRCRRGGSLGRLKSVHGGHKRMDRMEGYAYKHGYVGRVRQRLGSAGHKLLVHPHDG